MDRRAFPRHDFRAPGSDSIAAARASVTAPGFYDRALAFRRARATGAGRAWWRLAYSFQVVPHVPVTAHDVFMDFIVTERGIDELLADED